MTTKPTIHFRLDPRSGAAPYRQLIEQVLNSLESGRLSGGDKLPSVREVVGQILINPNTVHRAYRELERLGIVQSRPGLGTYIIESVSNGSNFSELRAGLQRWIREARDQGLSDQALEKLWREALARRGVPR